MAVNNSRNRDIEVSAQIAQVSDELFDLNQVLSKEALTLAENHAEGQSEGSNGENGDAAKPEGAQNGEQQAQPEGEQVQDESAPEDQAEGEVPIEQEQLLTVAQLKEEKFGDTTTLAVEDDGHNSPPHLREVDASRPVSVERFLEKGDPLSQLRFDLENNPDQDIGPEVIIDIELGEPTEPREPIICLPPEDLITLDEFKEQLKTEIINDNGAYNLDQGFNVAIDISTYEQFQEAITLIDEFGFNDDLADQGFTFYLGENTLSFNQEVNIDFNNDVLRILGCDCAVSFLDGQNQTRLLNIESGTVNVEHVSFINGNQVASLTDDQIGLILDNENLDDQTVQVFSGGAILLQEGAFLNSMESCFVDNEAVFGGAIGNIGGTLTIDGSEFFDNRSIAGGAIFNVQNGAQEGSISFIRESIFEDNISTDEFGGFNNIAFTYLGDFYDGGSGGAIFNLSTIYEISGSEFYSNSSGADGGAIATFGYVDQNVSNVRSITQIFDTIFEENSASQFGGAIYVEGEEMFLHHVDADFIRNFSEGSGGAISLQFVEPAPILPGIQNGFFGSFIENTGSQGGALHLDIAYLTTHLVNATFEGNIATSSGGAIYLSNSTLGDTDPNTIDGIRGSEFLMNEAQRGSGGAIFIRADSTIETIDFSSFIGNFADGVGGAIFIDNAATISLLQNSTLSGNTATSSGGGIYVAWDGTFELINFSTIAYNEALVGGDGIFVQAISPNSFGSLTLSNSIVAENDGDIDLEGMGFVSAGWNIIGGIDLSDFTPLASDNAGFLVTSLDLDGLDPNLTQGNLTFLGAEGFDNGWSYIPYYHNLLPGSLPIDYADPNSLVTFDQRAFFRPIDGDNDPASINDAGAIEVGSSFIYQSLIPPIVLDLDHDGIELISAQDSAITIQNSSGTYQLGWVSGDDGILVYDVNQDGIVNSLSEIALSRYHPDAFTDLQGLKLAFDSNGDNVFDHMDETFAHFGVWQDINENGVSEEGEFRTLMEADIAAIELEGVGDLDWVADNIVFSEGVYISTDGTEAIFGDVALTMDDIASTDEVTFIDDVAPDMMLIVDDAVVAVATPLVTFTVDDSPEVAI